MLKSSLVLSIAISLLIMQPLAGIASTPAEIETTIKESKDISKDKKYSVGFRDNEAQINTYDSTNVDQDCKIEAVLLGKVVMTKHTDVRRVVVNFYSALGTRNYKQVTVTKPEIVAFGTGAVSDSELLSSIRIDEKTSAAPSNGKEPDKDHADKPLEKGKDDKDKKTTIASANTNSSSSAHANGWTSYRIAGLSMQYPPGWRISTEMEGETLVTFRKGSTEDSTEGAPRIQLKLYKGDKHDTVMEVGREHASRHQHYRGFQITRPSGVISFGIGKSIKGICENFNYISEHGHGPRQYVRDLYFGWTGYVFKIGYSCKGNQEPEIDGLFKQMLGTIRVESAPK